MKKILLFIISLFFYSFAYSQYTVMLAGELNPNINQVYNYSIISGFHGVSGSKATWKVTNGYFNNASKSTTLTQDVDIMNADVVWTGSGKSGQISYSYSNGGVSYSGTYNVSIKGSGSSGGDNPETPGGGNGQIIGKTIWVEMIGPKEVPFNEDVRFYFPETNLSDRTIWTIDPDYFDIISKSDITGVEKVITLRPKKKLGQTKIKALCSYFGSEITVNIVKPNYKIESNTSIVCSNNTIVYTIKNASTTQSEAITWQSSTNMTLVSGQGTPNATFRASGNGYGTAKATVIYDGVSYQLENSRVWVGPPIYNYTADNNILTQYKDNYSEFTLKAFFEGWPTSHEWKVNGQPLSSKYNCIEPGDEMSIMFKYLPLGVYDYSVIAYNECGASRTVYFRVTITNDPNDAPWVKSVSIEDLSSAPVSIRIYSFPTGSLVYKENKAINFDIQNTTLNAGIYILEKTDEEGNVTREKVMKIK